MTEPILFRKDQFLILCCKFYLQRWPESLFIDSKAPRTALLEGENEGHDSLKALLFNGITK